MLLDPQKIESLIYEEIERYLKTLEPNPSPYEQGYNISVLFLLSHPLEDHLIAQTGLETIAKHLSCAFIRMDPFPPPSTPPFPLLPDLTSDNQEDFFKLKMRDLELVILFHPPLSLLAQMALGLTHDFVSRILLQALLKGIPVLAIQEESLSRICETSPETQTHSFSPKTEASLFRLHSSLGSLIRHYSKILEEWGINWVKPDHLFSSIQHLVQRRQTPATPNPSPPQTKSQRPVITEEDIKDRIKNGETRWSIPRNAIVTDLAQETAEKHGFIMTRELS